MNLSLSRLCCSWWANKHPGWQIFPTKWRAKGRNKGESWAPTSFESKKFTFGPPKTHEELRCLSPKIIGTLKMKETNSKKDGPLPKKERPTQSIFRDIHHRSPQKTSKIICPRHPVTILSWWLGCPITFSALYLGSITILRRWMDP